MKKSNYRFTLSIALLLLSLFLCGGLFAQETAQTTVVNNQLKVSDIEIPFIDRDGDGINDLLQNGWGLRFLGRYKKRQELWEKFNIEIVLDEDGKRMVDTDGDGIGDVLCREYMKEKMNELIDTDGDGVPDTPLREHLRRRFQSFDRDRDGLPDDFSREEMRAFMNQMREWRKQIRDRITQGLPPFVDEDGDGVPDNLPEGFGWRGFRRKGGK